ncbi:MAG: hypothetical protein H6645_10545 [Caldilineaceae bacterium]|nr:hypothetical protein [Caldilineaceae bacterium]
MVFQHVSACDFLHIFGRDFCLPLCLQLFPQTLSAQSAIDPRWQTLKQDDGLLSNDVLTILADEGAVWFGTSAGISRFDGAWQGYPGSTEAQFTDPQNKGQKLPRLAECMPWRAPPATAPSGQGQMQDGLPALTHKRRCGRPF